MNYKWSNIISHTLSGLGVKYACISPGARNSPITLAFIENKKISCFSQFDERSASFFALGITKSNKIPTAVICSSGTAVANFFPAIIESYMSCNPLIIITADRPKKNIGIGSNQTIWQKKIYGKYVRYFLNLNLSKSMTTQKVIKKLKKAYEMSIGSSNLNKILPGPIHINVQIDEPLLEKNFSKSINMKKEKVNSIFVNQPVQKEFIKKINSCNRALIICGGEKVELNNRDLIIKISKKLNAPIIADPISNIKYNSNHQNIISHFDLFWKHLKIKPDLIIRFGFKPTSKSLCEFIDDNQSITYLIDVSGGFNDNKKNIIVSDQKTIFNLIDYNNSNKEWLDYFKNLNQDINDIINQYNNKYKKLNESLIPSICIQHLNHDDQLIVGSSMPIRDLDRFAPSSINKNIRLYSNRGASGIDGVVSTALGITVNNKNDNFLLIGDLSFLHDINGLMLAKRYAFNLTIVIINNNGGGIFSLLPIKQKINNQFNEFWTTPHGLDFKDIAKLYNVKYFKVKSSSTLKRRLMDCKKIKGVKIIDVITNITSNEKYYKKLESKISTYFNI